MQSLIVDFLINERKQPKESDWKCLHSIINFVLLLVCDKIGVNCVLYMV